MLHYVNRGCQALEAAMQGTFSDVLVKRVMLLIEDQEGVALCQ